MKKFYLSIFWKFFIAIIFTVALFGILNIVFVWNKVFYTLDDEIYRRITIVGKNLSELSAHYILYKDYASLQSITDNTKNSDPIIEYCFVTDLENRVLSHTFNKGFPLNLLNANKFKKGDSITSVQIKAENFTAKKIKDITFPILDGKVGYVRVGINDESAWNDLSETVIIFILIFIGFTFLGFLGAYFFSSLITKPIIKIKSEAEKIDIDNIRRNIRIERNQDKEQKIQLVEFKDEIDDLTEKFNEMLDRLESTYNKLITSQNAMNQSEKLASIGTLVSGIAHEINNPLSGLKSCIRRISENPGNVSQNVKYINLMDDASGKIQSVVEGLLDFTRISSGLKSDLDITSILNNVINLVNYRKLVKPIAIKTNYNLINPKLLCNKNEMEQVFFNLIKNSIDAIEEKYKQDENYKGNIEISIFNFNSSMVVEIIDNGIGISKVSLGKVFDPFYTTKDVGKGTGLGCSISYNIVKDHKGEITIDSIENEWTKVKLVFQQI